MTHSIGLVSDPLWDHFDDAPPPYLPDRPPEVRLRPRICRSWPTAKLASRTGLPSYAALTARGVGVRTAWTAPAPCSWCSSRQPTHFSRAKSTPYAPSASINPIRANQPVGSVAYASSQQTSKTVPANPKIDDATQFTTPCATSIVRTSRLSLLLLFSPEDFIAHALWFDRSTEVDDTPSASAVPKWHINTRACGKLCKYFILSRLQDKIPDRRSLVAPECNEISLSIRIVTLTARIGLLVP